MERSASTGDFIPPMTRYKTGRNRRRDKTNSTIIPDQVCVFLVREILDYIEWWKAQR
jgi:hypothetical protein